MADLTHPLVSQPVFDPPKAALSKAHRRFCSAPLRADRSCDSSQPKAAGAGLAGRPTRFSLADRDLFFQDRRVVAANGAPTPLAFVQPNLAAIRGNASGSTHPAHQSSRIVDQARRPLADDSLEHLRHGQRLRGPAKSQAEAERVVRDIDPIDPLAADQLP